MLEAIGGVKTLLIGGAILTVVGLLYWAADDWAWNRAEVARLEVELREAVIANQSLVDARNRAERRHKAEIAALNRVAEADRERQERLVDLAEALAAIPAADDCTPGDALQNLIDQYR